MSGRNCHCSPKIIQSPKTSPRIRANFFAEEFILTPTHFGPHQQQNLFGITRIDYSEWEDIPSNEFERKCDSKLLLSDSVLNDNSGTNDIKEKRRESLIEWFDTSVEKELKIRRDKTSKIDNLENDV